MELYILISDDRIATIAVRKSECNGSRSEDFTAPHFNTSNLVKSLRRAASIKQSIELPLLSDYLDSPTSSKQIYPLQQGSSFHRIKYLAASHFTPDQSLL